MKKDIIRIGHYRLRSISANKHIEEIKDRAMKKCTFMRYLVTAIVTAAICWLMFRYSFRVERVYDAGDVVLVEVSILGQCEIHEVTK